MNDVHEVLGMLREKGNEKTRVILARHGNLYENTIGVSVADMKSIAKQIIGQQELAYELYDSGIMEARYLAGMVAKGNKMDSVLLDEWAQSAEGMTMVSEHTVPWVTVESADPEALALNWIQSPKDFVSAAGWWTLSGLAATCADIDLKFDTVRSLLETVETGVRAAQNRTRFAMISYICSVGAYIAPLLNEAKASAVKIGHVSIDVGDTSCRIPNALEDILKVERMGRVGRKKKTIRC